MSRPGPRRSRLPREWPRVESISSRGALHLPRPMLSRSRPAEHFHRPREHFQRRAEHFPKEMQRSLRVKRVFPSGGEHFHRLGERWAVEMLCPSQRRKVFPPLEEHFQRTEEHRARLGARCPRPISPGSRRGESFPWPRASGSGKIGRGASRKSPGVATPGVCPLPLRGEKERG